MRAARCCPEQAAETAPFANQVNASQLHFLGLFSTFFLSGDLRSQNRCPAKQCTNRVPIQSRGSAGSPIKDGSGGGGEIKKKKGRCGECEGCKVGDFNVGEI